MYIAILRNGITLTKHGNMIKWVNMIKLSVDSLGKLIHKRSVAKLQWKALLPWKPTRGQRPVCKVDGFRKKTQLKNVGGAASWWGTEFSEPNGMQGHSHKRESILNSQVWVSIFFITRKMTWNADPQTTLDRLSQSSWQCASTASQCFIIP